MCLCAQDWVTTESESNVIVHHLFIFFCAAYVMQLMFHYINFGRHLLYLHSFEYCLKTEISSYSKITVCRFLNEIIAYYSDGLSIC